MGPLVFVSTLISNVRLDASSCCAVTVSASTVSPRFNIVRMLFHSVP